MICQGSKNALFLIGGRHGEANCVIFHPSYSTVCASYLRKAVSKTIIEQKIHLADYAAVLRLDGGLMTVSYAYTFYTFYVYQVLQNASFKKSRTERNMSFVNLVKIINLEILIRKSLVLCGGGFKEIKRNEWEVFASESELSSLCIGLCASPLVAVSVPKYTELAEKQKN